MSATTPTADGPEADLDDRDVRALTEYLIVQPTSAPGLFTVYSEDGSEQTVDVEDGACTCSDAEYRDPAGGCKHERAAAFLTGERSLPRWVDEEAINSQLTAGAEGVLD